MGAKAKQEAGKPSESDVDEHTPGSRSAAAKSHKNTFGPLENPSNLRRRFVSAAFAFGRGEEQNQILTLGLGSVMEGKDLRGRRR